MTRKELRAHQKAIRENAKRPIRVLCSGLGNQLFRSDEPKFKYKAVHVGANPERKLREGGGW